MRPVGSHSDLREVPGVGPRIEQVLRDLGFTSLSELRGRDPEAMFEQLCELRDERVDRCVLYVFRTAVYYASESHPEARLLRWWNWKDDALAATWLRDRQT